MENSLDVLKELEGYRMFCHFTDKDPRLILNGDLGLEEGKWYTTMLELSKSDLNNIETFLEENFVKRAGNFRDSAIIIAVPEEIGYDFVIRNDGSRVRGMEFIVDNQYILCSIDNIKNDISFNEYAIAREDFFYR